MPRAQQAWGRRVSSHASTISSMPPGDVGAASEVSQNPWLSCVHPARRSHGGLPGGGGHHWPPVLSYCHTVRESPTSQEPEMFLFFCNPCVCKKRVQNYTSGKQSTLQTTNLPSIQGTCDPWHVRCAASLDVGHREDTCSVTACLTAKFWRTKETSGIQLRWDRVTTDTGCPVY